MGNYDQSRRKAEWSLFMTAQASRVQRLPLIAFVAISSLLFERVVPRTEIKMFTFNQINEYIDLLRRGEIVGRAVMKF